jgi:hypothetical protein
MDFKSKAPKKGTKMKRINPLAIRYPLGLRSSTANTLFFATIVVYVVLTVTVHAAPETEPMHKRSSAVALAFG